MNTSNYDNVQGYQIRPSSNTQINGIPYSSYSQGESIPKYYPNSNATSTNIPNAGPTNQQYYYSNNGQSISSVAPSSMISNDPSTNIHMGSKLFVGQVPAVCTEEQLIPIFSPYGRLLEVKVMREPNGRSKGSAWVRYETEDMARAAIAALNEKRVVPPQTNALRVQFATPNASKYQQRLQNPYQQQIYQQQQQIYQQQQQYQSNQQTNRVAQYATTTAAAPAGAHYNTATAFAIQQQKEVYGRDGAQQQQQQPQATTTTLGYLYPNTTRVAQTTATYGYGATTTGATASTTPSANTVYTMMQETNTSNGGQWSR